MKLSHVFSSCFVLASFVTLASASNAKTYTIHFGDSGPSPASLDVQVGDVINWDESFAYVHSDTVTNPAGARFSVVDHNCPDKIVGTLTVTMAGNYTYEDVVDEGLPKPKIYLASFTAHSSLSVDNAGEYSGISIALSASPTNGTGSIRVRSDRTTELHLSLFDATGVMVHDYQDITLNAGEFEQPLACEHLPAGTYYLRATSQSRLVTVTKIVLVH
jgi:plastocyanin